MKRNVKIVAIVTAIILALPVFESQKGINIVNAEAPSQTPYESPTSSPTSSSSSSPEASTSPSETPSATPSTSPEASASPSETPSAVPSTSPEASASPSETPSAVPSTSPEASASPSETPSTAPSISPEPSALPSETPSASPSVSPEPSPTDSIPQQIAVQETSGSTSTHEHSFEYITIQEASETQDAIIQLQCSCGETNGTFVEAGSAVHLFIRNIIKSINNAPQNGTVTVNTEIWTCYNKEVMDALSQRPDVTLVTNYRYNHIDYTVTIPAGYEVDTLLDENGYCGLRHLDQVINGSEITSN